MQGVLNYSTAGKRGNNVFSACLFCCFLSLLYLVKYFTFYSIDILKIVLYLTGYSLVILAGRVLIK